MSAAILIGKPCRQCRALIPLSIADKMGSEENQYLCEKCQAESFDRLHQVQAETADFWNANNEVEIDMGLGVAPPCAECGTEEGDERVLEMDFHGRAAMLCRSCGMRYLRANRDKIRNTRLEYDLKLR